MSKTQTPVEETPLAFFSFLVLVLLWTLQLNAAIGLSDFGRGMSQPSRP